MMQTASLDQDVISSANAWLAAGQVIHLATVIATWGSSPRPPGSLMAIGPQGAIVGSVSGGCIEDDLLARYGTVTVPHPIRLVYGATAEETARFGLPCGGQLEILLESLTEPEALRHLRQALQARQGCWREVELATGSTRLLPVQQPPQTRLHITSTHISKYFGPGFRLLLVGGGDIGHYTAKFALDLDYEVIVVEPRVQYAGQWRLTAAHLERRMPDDAVRAWIQDAASAVVTLTHDPKLDDMALLEALPSPALYVGALGSARTQAKRRQRLAELALEQRAIDRLHGPVGLPLGGRRPAEIALAIMAEITATRYKGHDTTGPARPGDRSCLNSASAGYLPDKSGVVGADSASAPGTRPR